MMAWTATELSRIGSEDEIQLASLTREGNLVRKPVTIWVVRAGDEVYVRSYRGRDSAWFRNTQEHKQGRIWAKNVTKDVRFVKADDAHTAVDEAFMAKYQRYGQTYVRSINSPQAQAATLKLLPLGARSK